MIKYDMPYEQDALEKLIYYNDMYSKYYPNNYVVEIGCSNNSWFINEPLSNLRGIRMDSEVYKILTYIPTEFPFKSIHKKISNSNICDVLKENNVPENFFMLCIDIDGPDYFILHAILKKYKPKIILTEYNQVIPYPVKFAVKASNNYVSTGGFIFGYSIACAEDIMKKYNYNIDDLIVNNIFFVRNDSDESPNVDEVEEFYKKGYLFNKKYPRSDESLFENEYTKEINFLHNYKNEDEIAYEFRKHILNNLINKYTGVNMSNNIDNYVINKEYEEHLIKFYNDEI